MKIKLNHKGGIYSILKNPIIYELVQWIFRHKKTEKAWYELIKYHKNKLILDVGCGPGETSLDFPQCKKYVGIDISKEYINNAKKNYGNFADFIWMPIQNLEKDLEKTYDKFDIIVIKGVYHHLDSKTINNMLEILKDKLTKNGKIVSMYPTYKKGYLISNFIVSLDRGKFVRNPQDLLTQISKSMRIKTNKTIFQIFPPYQRIIIELVRN